MSNHSRNIAVAGGAAAALLILGRVLRSPEGRLHVVGPRGYVEADPAGLASAAGVPLPVYALASLMQSEESSDRGRLAVGRAAWNSVRGRADKIFAKLAPSGKFGSQTVNPYAATSRAPTSRTLELARAVVDGRVPDFVEGATQWDAPAAQDRLHALYLSDPARYKKHRSSAEIAERRVAAGAREVRVRGVPSTRFWTYRG